MTRPMIFSRVEEELRRAAGIDFRLCASQRSYPSTTSEAAPPSSQIRTTSQPRLTSVGFAHRGGSELDVAVYDSDHRLVRDPIQNSMELLIPVRISFLIDRIRL